MTDETMELSLDDLDQVSGGGEEKSDLQIYYECFMDLGGLPEAHRLLPQGKTVVVNYICDFMNQYAPPEISAQNKKYAQKVYGMLL